MGYPLEEDEAVDHIVRRVGQHSKTHGFQRELELADWLEELAQRMSAPGRSVAAEDLKNLRESARLLRANFIGMKLALMHSEISEALSRLRDVGIEAVLAGDHEFVEELADVDIRTMETVSIIGASLGRSMIDKIARNAKRPFMHGRKH